MAVIYKEIVKRKQGYPEDEDTIQNAAGAKNIRRRWKREKWSAALQRRKPTGGDHRQALRKPPLIASST